MTKIVYPLLQKFPRTHMPEKHRVFSFVRDGQIMSVLLMSWSMQVMLTMHTWCIHRCIQNINQNTIGLSSRSNISLACLPACVSIPECLPACASTWMSPCLRDYLPVGVPACLVYCLSAACTFRKEGFIAESVQWQKPYGKNINECRKWWHSPSLPLPLPPSPLPPLLLSSSLFLSRSVYQ